jgi:uncharacterized coiled-coil protein SlyX
MTRNNIIAPMMGPDPIPINPSRPTRKRVRKQKVSKREVLGRLFQENTDLRDTITTLNQQISIVEAENTALANQLAFFIEQMNKNVGDAASSRPPAAPPIGDPPDGVNAWDTAPSPVAPS